MSGLHLVYDTHCHLEYIKTLSEHIMPAIVPGVSLGDIDELVGLRQQYPIYKIGFGLHPWAINDLNDLFPLWRNLTQLSADIYQYLSRAVIAHLPDFIGEIGLDKYKPDFIRQEHVFEAQLLVAKEFNLPVIIHCVRAYNEVLSLLKKHKIRSGIIHGFNANRTIARQFYESGFLLGIGAQITVKSKIAHDIVGIPLQHIVLESDAPYMPAFGKASSSSADCFLYAQTLAHKQNINLLEVINQSNQRVTSLFPTYQ